MKRPHSATDPIYFRDVAAQLHANGYRPLPIAPGGKKPGFHDWGQFEFTPGCEKRYFRYGAGVLLGDVVGLDIDVDDGECVAAIENAARDILGIAHDVLIPRRIGRMPRVLIPC